jgi:hypothetical protein
MRMLSLELLVSDKMMEMLLLSPTERAAMGLRGREKMEREYDEAIVIEQYIETVRALVGPANA